MKVTMQVKFSIFDNYTVRLKAATDFFIEHHGMIPHGYIADGADVEPGHLAEKIIEQLGIDAPIKREAIEPYYTEKAIDKLYPNCKFYTNWDKLSETKRIVHILPELIERYPNLFAPIPLGMVGAVTERIDLSNDKHLL